MIPLAVAKYAPWAAAVVAVFVAGVVIRQDGYNDGRRKAEADCQAAKYAAQAISDKLSGQLRLAVADININTDAAAKRINDQRSVDTVRLTKELTHEVRYSSPECSLTSSVFDEINRIRSGASAPAPVSFDGDAVPGPTPVKGQAAGGARSGGR